MGGTNIDPERYERLTQVHDLTKKVAELEHELKGPDGFETWKDAAIDERVRRVQTETQVAELSAVAEALEDLIEQIFEDSEEIEDFLRISGGRNHIVIADDINKWVEAVENNQCLTPNASLIRVKRKAFIEGYLAHEQPYDSSTAKVQSLIRAEEEAARRYPEET